MAHITDMAGSEKSNSIVSVFSSFLLEAWNKWDVRGMVLFSLTLQIALSVLGKRRKYKIHRFYKIILWFAYIGADWIAIATLGKLSSSHTKSPITNVLRAYWAPLLLLHLGGPDTITAYSFEDNKFWIRHLIVFVVRTILVVYIVCLSWTFSWVSFLSLPLVLAGIIKHIERILCLMLISLQKITPVISNIDPGDIQDKTLDRLLKENPNELRAYLLFAIMRPDVNDYLSSQNISSASGRIQTYLKETTGREESDVVPFLSTYFNMDPFLAMDELTFRNPLDIIAIELGFIFDVVYTKAALIYTKLGCWLRLISFASSFSVLLIFFIGIINQLKFSSSIVDIVITGILLSGATALEISAALVMLSSVWATLVAEFHHNGFVRKIFKATLKFLPFLLHPSKKRSDRSIKMKKRWSGQIGQFDLLNYCFHYKKRKANQPCGILQKISNGCHDIAEMCNKYRFTTFVQVPSDLKESVTNVALFSQAISRDTFRASRGDKALQGWNRYDDLKWSIESDFDYSIIIWHLATSVCFYQEDPDEITHNEAMKISKHTSDYMMYLLAMSPALLFPEHSKSFWLDHTYNELKELVSSATDIRIAASTLDKEKMESSCGETTFQNLRKDVFKLATILQKTEDNWEMIKVVWIEMLVYAAFSCQHISHVKQLGEGIEFLSLIWLLLGPLLVKALHYLQVHADVVDIC